MIRVTYSGPGGGGNKVYDLTAGKSLPDFVDEAIKKRQKLRKNQELKKRIELINDFEFKVAANKVRFSADGSFIGAIGTYPGAVKVVEAEELSVKFARGLDAEPIDMLFLTDDYRKLVILLDDRYVEFHAQGGRHHRLRVPNFCRKLCYNRDTATLYFVGSCAEIYRLDLEVGAFEPPYTSAVNDDISALALCPSLPLLLTGGMAGVVEGWDLRIGRCGFSRSAPVTSVVAFRPQDYDINGRGVTCADFSPHGLEVAVGMASGIVRVFDIRTNKSFCERDHNGDLPIKELQCVPCSKAKAGGVATANELTGERNEGGGGERFDGDDIVGDEWLSQAGANISSEFAEVDPHGGNYGGSSGPTRSYVIASCDSRSVNLWSPTQSRRSAHNIQPSSEDNSEPLDGTLIASIQPNSSVNGVAVWPESGLVFVPKDEKRVGVYHVPAMGIAPRWCSFLDSMAVDLEEQAKDDMTAVFNDMQFVTKSELDQLGASHLLGTEYVRPYMHGFFINIRLYKKLKTVSEPFAFEEYRKQRVRERLESRRKMRISVPKEAKANLQLLKRLQVETEQEGQQNAVDSDDQQHKKLRKRSKGKKSTQEQARQLLADERFARIFSNPDFEIEEAEA